MTEAIELNESLIVVVANLQNGIKMNMNVQHFAITFNDLFIVDMLIAAAATTPPIQTEPNFIQHEWDTFNGRMFSIKFSFSL